MTMTVKTWTHLTRPQYNLTPPVLPTPKQWQEKHTACHALSLLWGTALPAWSSLSGPPRPASQAPWPLTWACPVTLTQTQTAPLIASHTPVTALPTQPLPVIPPSLQGASSDMHSTPSMQAVTTLTQCRGRASSQHQVSLVTCHRMLTCLVLVSTHANHHLKR